MNGIQQAIARVTGLDEQFHSLEEHQAMLATEVDSLVGSNALLQRALEDVDYLNLFDINDIVEVLPYTDRKKTLLRLRRLRVENPIAKQSVKLVLRFTLGKGVQYIVTADPGDSEDPFGGSPKRGVAISTGPQAGQGGRLQVAASEDVVLSNESGRLRLAMVRRP